MQRASLFIDGNALFQAIDELNEASLKWLDPARLASQLAADHVQIRRLVFAFTVTGEDRARAQQERTYLRALSALGVACLTEDPVREFHECGRCGHGWDDRRARHNEANLALEILHDAWSDSFDEAWLVTDQIGESHLARKLARFQHKSLTLLSLRSIPRMMHDTATLKRKTLTKRQLRAATLSETVRTAQGEMIARPRGWAPRESATWRDLEITGL